MLLTLLVVSVLLCILAVAWILRCNSNKWQMKSRKRRNAAILAIMLSLAFTLTGCSKSKESQSFIYNSSADYNYMGYEIIQSDRSLFGIDYETGDKWKFLEFHYAFFLNRDSLFFIGNDGITQVNRFTRGITKLDIPTNGSIAFDGESIFYKNEQSVLTRYDVSSGETTLYENIVAYSFCIDEQSIYYVSRTDGGLVYSCDKDGNNQKLISDTPAMSVTCDADRIYVLARESGKEIVFWKSRCE